MSAWIDTLGELFAAHTACVMVTVTESGGSTPREAGTKMIVTGGAIFGTIGGGHLILFGIRPQYRAQSNAMFKMFFNSLYYH